jgi:hypothetical protein
MTTDEISPWELLDTIRAELRPVFEADVALTLLYEAAVSVDVDRLAAAIKVVLPWDDDQWIADQSAAIAAAYEAIPTCGVCTDLANPHGECPEHGA